MTSNFKPEQAMNAPSTSTPSPHGLSPIKVPVLRKTAAMVSESIASLPEGLLPLYTKLQPIVDQQAQRELISMYRVGQIIEEWRHDETLVSRTDRGRVTKAMDLVAVALNINPSILASALLVVQTYSPEEYALLVNQQPISWMHIQHLLDVPAAAERQLLVDPR